MHSAMIPTGLPRSSTARFRDAFAAVRRELMKGITGRSLGIALRPVKRVVWGRENQRRRVTYMGEDGNRRTPEQTILWRWRRAGFKGHRLRPNIWRVLGQIPALRSPLTVEEIERILEGKKQEGGEIAKLLPRPGLVRDLLSAVSPARLNLLLARHAPGSEVDPRRPGVPDLFLFKLRSDGAPWAVRFVEVKRPDEPLRPHQVAEIRFLRTLRFKAGMVRLIEQPGPPR